MQADTDSPLGWASLADSPQGGSHGGYYRAGCSFSRFGAVEAAGDIGFVRHTGAEGGPDGG